MPNKETQQGSHHSKGNSSENSLSDSVSSSTTDEDLLDLIANNNQQAFSVLYKRYDPVLLKFCTRMLNGDVSLAADIVDEALFEVWKVASKFAGKSKPSTWIHSIARNKLVDYLRKNSDSKIDKELLRISMDVSSPSAEDKLMGRQQQRSVVRHMDKLSPDHKEVLLLAYFKELSVKEMAVTLNISENTVKTRLFYARQRFKKILSRAGLSRD